MTSNACLRQCSGVEGVCPLSCQSAVSTSLPVGGARVFTTQHFLFPVQDLSCFLVDNNGFVVLSKDRSEVRPRPPRPQGSAAGC